jgi:hypothetical protein
MLHTVSFDTRSVQSNSATTQGAPATALALPLLPVLKPVGKKRERKSKVYTMTKVEGEFVIDFI